MQVSFKASHLFLFLSILKSSSLVKIQDNNDSITDYGVPKPLSEPNGLFKSGYLKEEHCGKRFKEYDSLTETRVPAEPGEFPWHAAIFRKSGNKGNLYYKCGGSLISQTVVISTAHCVLMDYSPVSEKFLKIFLGLHNRDRIAEKDAYAIHKIIIHDSFDLNSGADNIALLKLKTKARYGERIQPICLWPAEQSPFNYVEHKHGVVPGWGSHVVLATILLKVSLEVVGPAKCLERDPNFYGNILTTKNFCAGNKNITEVCANDNGGGLSFEQNGTWFLRGILSVGKLDGYNEKCISKGYVVFTDVAQHLEWIEKHMKDEDFEPILEIATTTMETDTNGSSVLSTRFNDVSLEGQTDDDSESLNDYGVPKPFTVSDDLLETVDLTDESCGKRLFKEYDSYTESRAPAKPGEFPWHVAVFGKSSIGLYYIQGGSLISQNAVISTARNLFFDEMSVSEDFIKVFLEMNNTELDFDEEKAYSVSKIIIHDGYNFNPNANDIALLKLKTKAVYSEFIQPICLWPATQGSLSSVVNKRGILPGWGIFGPLQKVSLRVVSTGKCLENDINAADYILTKKNFCAGNKTVTRVCANDNGGGLIFEQNGAWFLRGILSSERVHVSREKGIEAQCVSVSYVVFIDVAQHLDWIEDHLIDIEPIRELSSIGEEIISTHTPTTPPIRFNQFFSPLKTEDTTDSINDYGIPKPHSDSDELLENEDFTAEHCGKRMKKYDSYTESREPAKRGEFPWYAAIFYKSGSKGKLYYNCGGTLISQKFVISAASCLYKNYFPFSEKFYKIFLGIYNGDHVDERNANAVQKIIKYENNNNVNNDIALLKLKTKAEYGELVQPICLWPAAQGSLSSVVKKRGILPGWGIFGPLEKVSLQVVSTEKCLENDINNGLASQNFCAGNKTETQVCADDNGGGLIFEQNGTWFLRGILSIRYVHDPDMKEQCVTRGSYAVFTDVVQYLWWIETHIKEEFVYPTPNVATTKLTTTVSPPTTPSIRFNPFFLQLKTEYTSDSTTTTTETTRESTTKESTTACSSFQFNPIFYINKVILKIKLK